MERKSTLYKPFVAELNRLKEKYGEMMFKLSGISDEQLDESKMMDNLIDSSVTADVSIDPTSNIGNMDIDVIMHEVQKPQFKIKSLNRLFKDMVNIYGVETANLWLESEITGALYLHDGFEASFKPYSYFSKTVLLMKINDEKIYTTIEDFYNILKLKYEENIINDTATEIYLKNVEILHENNIWVNVSRILKHKSHTNLVQIETKNGFSTIVTEDHPVILENNKEKNACDLSLSDYLKTSNSLVEISDDNKISEDFGYFIGFLLGDGWIERYKNKENNTIPSRFSIRQNDIKNTKIYKIVNNLFDNVSILKNGTQINFGHKKDVESLLDIGFGSNNKKLPKNVLSFGEDAIKNIIAGIIDSDGTINNQNGMCTIRLTSFELIQQLAELFRSLNIGKTRTYFCGKYNSKKSFKSNYELYGLGCRISDKSLANYSVKIQNNYDLVFKDVKKDGRFETSQIKRINIIECPDYVYDITTSVGQFHCQGLIQHNCYNYTCETVAKKGMFFDPALKADVAKHLHSFHEHMLEFVRFCTKRQSGSVGIGDFLIWSNYFFHKDKLEGFLGITDWEKYKQQNFQNFVYSLNQSGARAGQSAFTNVSIFDREYLFALFADKTYPDGSYVIDHVEEIIQYQKDFLNFLKTEREKKLLTFPVLGASLLFKDGKFVDEEFARFCSDHIYLWKDLPIMCEDDVTSVSSCCRLKSSLKTMGLFSSILGASSEIGSIKVSTANLNRIGLDVGFDKEKFFVLLKQRSILNLKILYAQRKRIEKNIEKGIMSLYSLGLMKLRNQYSTFGISAFGDVMEGFGFLQTDKFGNQYYTEEGYEFGAKIFEIIDSAIEEMNFDFMVNKEAVPFESGAITCVKKDKLIYGELVKSELYSNQWLSLGKNSTLQEKIKSASKFDKNCSGGSMLFVNVEGEFASKEQTWDLLNDIAKQGVVTINVVTKLNICKNEHNYREKTNICPICGEPKVDEATKIVGFYTRKSNWQKERREEDRKWFNFEDKNVN